MELVEPSWEHRPYNRPAYLRRVMDSIRQNKVNSLLQRELAEIFRQEARNLLPGGIITVSAVRVSPDLGLAKVFLSLFPVKEKAATMDTVSYTHLTLPTSDLV